MGQIANARFAPKCASGFFIPKTDGHVEVTLKGGLVLLLDECDAHWIEGRNLTVQRSPHTAYVTVRHNGKQQNLCCKNSTE